MSRVPKSVLRLPLEKRAEIAFKEVVEEVIDEHARLGLLLYIWRDGKVVRVPPDEIDKLANLSRRYRSF